MRTLRSRWLGRVPYAEATDLQYALHDRTHDDYLLLLEHPSVYTLGTRADPAHVLVPPARVGADLATADRGGDVTYHGPGQLVGYPVVTLAEWRDGRADVVAYVRTLEQILVEVLGVFGIAASGDAAATGVWVGDHKIAAIGVKVSRRRARHGFALNVDPDLAMFDHIVPCGIRDRGVTSMARVLGTAPPMAEVVDAVVTRVAARLGYESVDHQAVAFTRGVPVAPVPASVVTGATGGLARPPAQGRAAGEPVRLLGRLAAAGVAAPGPDTPSRRPDWMRVRADLGAGYRETKRLVRGLALTTVCEEAGCPNIYECWADRTATFMVLGERCTRACGFCLVDTRHPLAPDPDEPSRVADAVAALGLQHAVVTSVARDDLPDGGASHFARTIAAIRDRAPQATIEVLIPDCKGDADALDVILDARPDVLNHNLETVARLQRAVRPNAGYARSLTVLARAHGAGLVVKSGLIAGLGETEDELRAAITDLRSVGVGVLTVGQYLRPSPAHAPVARWWTPDEFAALGAFAEDLGFTHVECGPLVRSSYHAKRAVQDERAVAEQTA
ncbi:MAG: lipoyl synthase [Actinomycetota bacterium]